MEPVNVESYFSATRNRSLKSGQENFKIDSVVESMPRENSTPGHCEGNVQANTTTLAETRTKRNTKRKIRAAV